MASEETSSQETRRTRQFIRLQKKLGKRVRALRHEREMTLAKCEDASGIAWRHWQKIEAGQVNLTLVTLHRVANALSTDIERAVRKD